MRESFATAPRRARAALAVSLFLNCACSSEDVGSSRSSVYLEPYRLSITVPDVPPGAEGTKCVKVRVGNTAPVAIGKVHNVLSKMSHHLVVSAVTEPKDAERSLFDCIAFQAAILGAPLTLTQKHEDTIELPEGVGFSFGADQLMHLEVHYLNTSREPQDVSAEIELFPLSGAAPVQEASFVIVGDLDIRIPPHSTHRTPSRFVQVPAEFADVSFYGVTGHTHRFGTDVKLGIAANDADPGETLYAPDDFEWSEPEIRYFRPPFRVPQGGGFRFECEWNNPTGETIRYGESALTEMCFFWAYYYPKREGPRAFLTGWENSPYVK